MPSVPSGDIFLRCSSVFWKCGQRKFWTLFFPSSSLLHTRGVSHSNMYFCTFLFLHSAAVASAAPQLSGLLPGSSPQVTLDYGTFKGNTAFSGVYSFLGMPFAKAGRLQNPTLISAADHVSGVRDATRYGKACPQQELVALNPELGGLLGAVEEVAFAPVSQQGEDCLTINVQIPAGVNDTSKLPVMMWIFGVRRNGSLMAGETC